MLVTLVGIQSICIGISVFLTYKSSHRSKNMKLIKKDKKTGFKYFKAGGF